MKKLLLSLIALLGIGSFAFAAGYREQVIRHQKACFRVCMKNGSVTDGYKECTNVCVEPKKIDKKKPCHDVCAKVHGAETAGYKECTKICTQRF